jgi:hypothetical protein
MSGSDDADRAGAGDGSPEDDPERAELLRDVADDIRGDTAESEQVAALLYRVSDLYDPDEERTPEGIYRDVRNILRVKERGGLRREHDS